jgi:hypothetical protein
MREPSLKTDTDNKKIMRFSVHRFGDSSRGNHWRPGPAASSKTTRSPVRRVHLLRALSFTLAADSPSHVRAEKCPLFQDIWASFVSERQRSTNATGERWQYQAVGVVYNSKRWAFNCSQSRPVYHSVGIGEQLWREGVARDGWRWESAFERGKARSVAVGLSAEKGRSTNTDRALRRLSKFSNDSTVRVRPHSACPLFRGTYKKLILRGRMTCFRGELCRILGESFDPADRYAPQFWQGG